MSGRSPPVASTGSTTACCSGPTCTPCSTVATWAWTPIPARVSPRLREEFGNGEQFYAQAGQVIELPARRADRPNREFLEWHLDEVFKAS